MREHEKKVTEYVSNKITCLSFVLTIVVVFIHGGTLEYYRFGNDNESFIYHFVNFVGGTLGSLAVPTFFMISGYLFFVRYSGNVKKKLVNRFKTLIIPYIIWNCLYTVFYLSIPRVSFLKPYFNNVADEISVRNILEGIFLYKYNFPFWYLAWLIIFCYSAPLFLIFLRNKWTAVGIQSILGVLVLLNVNIPGVRLAPLFFYFLGAIIGYHFPDLAEIRLAKKRHILLIGIFTIIQIIRSRFELNSIIDSLTYLLSPVLLWIVFQKKEFQVTNNFLKQSFFIYSSHVVIITTVFKLFSKVGGYEASQLWILFSYLSSPVLTICILFGVYKVMLNCFPKLYNVLTGNRNSV